MLQIILWTVIAFLTIVGVTHLAGQIRNFLYSPGKCRFKLVIVSKGHNEKIEYEIRSLVVRLEELCRSMHALVIIIDDGMDAETRAICEKLAEEYGEVRICASAELPEILLTDGI